MLFCFSFSECFGLLLFFSSLLINLLSLFCFKVALLGQSAAILVCSLLIKSRKKVGSRCISSVTTCAALSCDVTNADFMAQMTNGTNDKCAQMAQMTTLTIKAPRLSTVDF